MGFVSFAIVSFAGTTADPSALPQDDSRLLVAGELWRDGVGSVASLPGPKDGTRGTRPPARDGVRRGVGQSHPCRKERVMDGAPAVVVGPAKKRVGGPASNVPTGLWAYSPDFIPTLKRGANKWSASARGGVCVVCNREFRRDNRRSFGFASG